MSKPHSMGGECGGQLESTLRMVNGSLKRCSKVDQGDALPSLSSLELAKGEASENACTGFSKLIPCSNHPNAFSNDGGSKSAAVSSRRG
jgi:hypothetical protein